MEKRKKDGSKKRITKMAKMNDVLMKKTDDKRFRIGNNGFNKRKKNKRFIWYVVAVVIRLLKKTTYDFVRKNDVWPWNTIEFFNKIL